MRSIILTVCLAFGATACSAAAKTPAKQPVAAKPAPPAQAPTEDTVPNFTVAVPDGWKPAPVPENLTAMGVKALLAYGDKNAQVGVAFFAPKEHGSPKDLVSGDAARVQAAGFQVSDYQADDKRASFRWSVTGPDGSVVSGKVVARLFPGGKYGILVRGAWEAQYDAAGCEAADIVADQSTQK
jgi:hypothetical protein